LNDVECTPKFAPRRSANDPPVVGKLHFSQSAIFGEKRSIDNPTTELSNIVDMETLIPKKLRIEGKNLIETCESEIHDVASAED
jgi:hypothetical protein